MEIITYDYRVHKDKKIIIYGIKEMGYITGRCLQELGVPVYCYADRLTSYHALFGNVISIEEMLAMCEKEDIIILFSIMGYARGEVKYLYQRGIRRVYSVRKLWKIVDLYSIDWNDACRKVIDKAELQFFTEDTIKDPHRLYLYSLDAVVTERCSLKCKDCSNLMQYYQKPQNMDICDIKKAIDIILHKDCRIYDLRILGGEPLMNKEFTKIIDWYKDEEKIGRISVYSNATIFPDNSVLEHLKSGKVYISLSDYGPLSYKLKEWVQWCKKNNVRYEVKKIERWQECGKLERHDYCESELRGIYGECDCRNLPTIKGEYLYNCPYAANAADLGAMTFDEMSRDRMLLTDSISEEDIDKFLYERKYLEACRYCKGRNLKQAEILPYVQIKQPLMYRRLLDEQAVVNTLNDEVIRMDELVSVVIPAYNVEEQIERCLVSVLKSSYQNLEVIVVDDGSEDGTLWRCRRIAEQDTSGRIRIIENEHVGVVRTRNTGILAAKGKYISFVDADDYIDSERLASMVGAMDGCDLVCAGHTILRDEKLIGDRLMDRGQSMIEIKPYPIPEGVYTGESLYSFIKRSFKGFWQGDNVVCGYLWQYLFRADMMKDICERIDPSIWYSEDTLLSHIYTSSCNRVCVIKNYGYYYCLRNLQNRYHFEGILANVEKIYHCLYDEFKKHSKIDLFEFSLQQEYVEYVIGGLGRQGKNNISIRSIYYPYYGRLKDKKVILYGAGNVGKAYYRHMKDDGECFLVAWVDKNAERLRESDFLPVESVDCLHSIDYDYVVIAVFDEIAYHAIRKELVSKGIREEMIIWNPTKYEW